MVEELISSIKNAEIKAEGDIKDSVKQSREIMRLAGDKAAAMRKEGDAFIQEQVRLATEEGKQLAEEEYSKIMFGAHQRCVEIGEIAEANSAKEIDFVRGGLYKKYGSR